MIQLSSATTSSTGEFERIFCGHNVAFNTEIPCRLTMASCWNILHQELEIFNAWDVTVWTIMSKGSQDWLHEIIQVDLLLLTGGARIVNAQTVCVMARIVIHWQRFMPSLIVKKVYKTKCFSAVHFPLALIVIRFFPDYLDFYMWIDCLLLAFDFIANWYWTKLCKSHKVYNAIF